MTSIHKPIWFDEYVEGEAENFRVKEDALAWIKREFKLLFQDINDRERIYTSGVIAD